MNSRRKFTLLAALALLLAAIPAIAAIDRSPPKGKYRGTQQAKAYGSGSKHKLSFVVRRGQLRKLVIGRGQAYCYAPRVRQSGFAPGYFDAPSPRLKRFPPAKLKKSAGRYQLKVTYRRTGKRWRITRSRERLQGTGYVALRGSFRGKRFEGRGRVTFRVRYGADADGRSIWRRGKQQCIFEGRLAARRRR
jgi:hypothetical protein